MTDTLPFDASSSPPRLNLGCGFDLREGYLNVDFQDHHHPDLVADVRRLPMLQTGFYDELLAIDVLEHLPRSDTATCLDEWHRLLRPGGRIEVQTPDVVACGRLLRRQDTVADHQQLIHQLWGTQAYTGDFHLAGFTDLVLIAALTESGFHHTRIEARDGWMLVATAEKRGDEAPDPLAIGWVTGFYAPETGPDTWWRWADGAAELLLFNTAAEAIDARVAFDVSRPDGRTIELDIDVGTATDKLTVGSAPEHWERVVRIEPGPRRLQFTSDAEPLDAPGDPRRLMVFLGRPEIMLL